jgi:hypothetical protein
MPVGKSGKYYNNPSVMRQRDDDPGTDVGINGNIAPPDAKADAGEHKLEICKRDDGSMAMSHIHPDGFTEEHDPATAQEVLDHVNDFVGDGDGTTQPDPTQISPDDDPHSF